MGMKYIIDENQKMFSVIDKLPEGIFQYEYVIAYLPSQKIYEELYYLRDENNWQDGCGRSFSFDEVSHWSPFPSPSINKGPKE
jgi:hypothetical protein